MDLTNLNFNKDRSKLRRKPSVDLSSMVYGKVPPQAKELEEAVLGAIMLEKSAFDTVVEISANGMEARVRGLELGMLGDADKGTAAWSVSTFINRFVKGEDGKWRIREMRIFPLFKTDYYQGWGKSRIVGPAPDAALAPDKPLPAADTGDNLIPAFLPNPVTGMKSFTGS